MHILCVRASDNSGNFPLVSIESHTHTQSHTEFTLLLFPARIRVIFMHICVHIECTFIPFLRVALFILHRDFFVLLYFSVLMRSFSAHSAPCTLVFAHAQAHTHTHTYAAHLPIRFHCTLCAADSFSPPLHIAANHMRSQSCHNID